MNVTTQQPGNADKTPATECVARKRLIEAMSGCICDDCALMETCEREFVCASQDEKDQTQQAAAGKKKP